MTKEEFIEKLKSIGFYYPSKEVLRDRKFIVRYCYNLLLFYDYDNSDFIAVDPEYGGEQQDDYEDNSIKVQMTLYKKANILYDCKYELFSSYDEAWEYLND